MNFGGYRATGDTDDCRRCGTILRRTTGDLVEIAGAQDTSQWNDGPVARADRNSPCHNGIQNERHPESHRQCTTGQSEIWKNYLCRCPGMMLACARSSGRDALNEVP
jgi:hypothetical protein